MPSSRKRHASTEQEQEDRRIANFLKFPLPCGGEGWVRGSANTEVVLPAIRSDRRQGSWENSARWPSRDRNRRHLGHKPSTAAARLGGELRIELTLRCAPTAASRRAMTSIQP
jgi:hypothetical protein